MGLRIENDYRLELEIGRRRRYVAAMVRILLAGIVLAAGLPPAAAIAAPDPKPLGTFGAWTAFAYTEGRDKVCYALGRPKDSEPKAAKRDEIYITVTHRSLNKVRGEVGVYVGYPLKEKSSVDVAVGMAKFTLFVKDDSAWTPEAKLDRALAEAMAAGRTMTVKGTSARGTATTDTYDLQGFRQALKAIDTACPA